MIWSEFWTGYLDLRLAACRQSTVAHARSCGRLVFSGMDVQAIDNLWAAKLSRALLLRFPRATASSYARRLQAGLSWGATTGLLGEPVRLHVPLGPARPRGLALGATEYALMLERSRRSHDYLPRVIQGLWCSGLRLSELLSLEYQGSSWGVRSKNGVWLLEFPAAQKSGRRDCVPATPEMARLLEPAPLLGSRAFPVPYSVRTTGRHILACGHHPHDLRRSFAMRWAEAGLAESELATLLRHRHVSTTRQYYTTVDALRLARRLERIG